MKFFLQYDVIYYTKEGFGHLIVAKVVIRFEFPIGENKVSHPIEN